MVQGGSAPTPRRIAFLICDQVEQATVTEVGRLANLRNVRDGVIANRGERVRLQAYVKLTDAEGDYRFEFAAVSAGRVTVISTTDVSVPSSALTISVAIPFEFPVTESGVVELRLSANDVVLGWLNFTIQAR